MVLFFFSPKINLENENYDIQIQDNELENYNHNLNLNDIDNVVDEAGNLILETENINN